MSARPRSARRRLVASLVLMAVATGVAGPTDAAPPCWFPPVVAAVSDPFRAPPCTWCAGNRGIEYRVTADTVVRAAASGRVVFAGTVVDVRYVVVQLSNGWRHTYGRLAAATVELGDVVLANEVVGTASATLFFGLRIGDDYADPAPYIGVARRRPRLVPLDGTPARPAPPTQLRCPKPAGSPAKYGADRVGTPF